MEIYDETEEALCAEPLKMNAEDLRQYMLDRYERRNAERNFRRT